MTKTNTTKKTSSNRRSAIPRPLNSFMIFRKEHQASVSKEFSGVTHQEISKKLSTKWKALTPEEKQDYNVKAQTAKEKHKLQYPNYKYSPRRRVGPSKTTKKSSNSKASAVQTVPSHVEYQPQLQHSSDFLSKQPDTTFVHPLPAVDVTIALNNDLDDDDTLTTSTCYDSLLLCPTLHGPSYHDPSASPSTFSIVSQFSGISSSLSSDYEPNAGLHYPECLDALSVHCYYCCPPPDTHMPPSYECVPFIDYSHMGTVAFPRDVCDAPIVNIMHPQIIFPEAQHQLPPAILNHTQPMLQADVHDTIVHNADFGSFSTYYAAVSETPLLTQPFVYMDFETMPY